MRRGDLMRGLILAIAFGGADALSALTNSQGSGIAGIWLPGGIGLAGLLLWGIRLWPAIALGAVAAAPAYGALGAATIPVIAANVLAIMAAAWAIRGLGADPRLGRLSDVARFALGCLVGAVPFGVLGITALLTLGPRDPGSTGGLVALWLLSTVTGFIIVGGAITVLTLRRRHPLARQRIIEVGALATATALFAWMAFVAGSGVALLPLILTTALLAGRGGPRGAALASLIFFGFASWTVVEGGGPFGGGTVLTRSLTYQTAVILIGVGLQAIGAIGSGEPGSAPDTPSRSLALGLLVGGAVSLGISEAVVSPELILVAKKAQITLLSMTIALIVVIGALAGTGLRGHVRTLRRARGRLWIPAVVAGLAVFGAEELFLLALTSIPVIEAVVLASIAPILLLIVGVARREVRPSLLLTVGLLAVLGGFYCLTPGQTWLGGISAPGVWLAAASSACTAVALLALGVCRPHSSAGPVSLLVFASAMVAALVLCISQGIVPGEIVFEREELMGGALYVSIAGALIPIVVATWAVPLLGATRVAAFEVLAPVVAVGAALAWGEAAINAWTVAGVTLVVVGLAIGWRAHVGSHADAHGPPEPRFFSHS